MRTCFYCGRGYEDGRVRCEECGSELTSPRLSPRQKGVIWGVLALAIAAIVVPAVMRFHLEILNNRAHEIRTASLSNGICTIHQMSLQTSTVFAVDGIIHFGRRVAVYGAKSPNAVSLIYSKEQSPHYSYETEVVYCPMCDEDYQRAVWR
jgi:hypothetical protein